jgi:peptidoglycan hydrolase CwlO-like protein
MRQTFKKIVFITAIVASFWVITPNVYAETNDERIKRLGEEISQYEKELERLGAEANTLSNLVAQYNAQIKLTQLKISRTEEKILLLGGRIDQLKDSLDALNVAYAQRVEKTYKMSRFSEGYLLFISLQNIDDAINSFNYLKRLQEADIGLLARLQNAQSLYEQEKSGQEALQKDLEIQKASLSSQKNAKAKLLEQTKNDEKKYQSLLAAIRAEMEAIQAIIAGQGQEEMVRHVSEGEKIASIISGASCNSSGTHLHFIIAQNRVVQNPFSYLRSGISYENCSGLVCGGSDGDPFAPAGSWNWPVSERIEFFQGYGSTWAIKNSWVGRIYSFHNGIDVDSESSSDVKAVKTGNLYRGSYMGYNSCRLRYVRIDHDDSEIDTYYLHINY